MTLHVYSGLQKHCELLEHKTDEIDLVVSLQSEEDAIGSGSSFRSDHANASNAGEIIL